MDEIRSKDRFTGKREGKRQGGRRNGERGSVYDKPVHALRCSSRR